MTFLKLGSGTVGWRRRSALLALTLGPVLALPAACTPAEVSVSCISWVSYEDEDARVEAADVVVDAVVRDRAGERAMFGIEAAVWRVETMTVVKGDVEPGEWLEVASTPVTCTAGETYPQGDPLDVSGPVRLFLTDGDFADDGTEHGLALITPIDGVGQVTGD